MDLTERKKQILKRVVEDYIAAAEPVGSKALAEEMGGSCRWIGSSVFFFLARSALPSDDVCCRE